MNSPVPVPFSGKGLQQSPRRRNCEPSIWVKSSAADAEAGTSRRECSSQAMGKQAKSANAAAAATDAGAACKRASLTALAGMFLLDEALLIITSTSLWSNGISPLPLVPMIINRASEMAVVVGTQHPVHVVLGALQMVLAVAAGVLFAYADGTCHRIANAFDDNCSIVMICFVIFICEVVVLGTEVLIHMPWRKHGAPAYPQQKAAQSLPHAGKQGANVSKVAGAKSMTSDMEVSASEKVAAKHASLASMERGCDSALAMQPWDLSVSAAAAIDWLREGAVVTDWWQMSQEEARDSANITVRGMGGEAIVLEDAPTFQPMPGKGESKRDPVVITGLQQLQVSTITETTDDAFAYSPGSSSSTETPKQQDSEVRLSMDEPYGPSPMQSFRATSSPSS